MLRGGGEWGEDTITVYQFSQERDLKMSDVCHYVHVCICPKFLRSALTDFFFKPDIVKSQWGLMYVKQMLSLCPNMAIMDIFHQILRIFYDSA